MTEHILALEHRVLTAINQSDKAAMRELMTPDGLGVDAEFGFATQASLIDGIHQLRNLSWSIVAPRVMPAGERSFLIAYELHQEGTFAGQAIPPKVYASTVWTLRGGAWKAVFHQETTPVAVG